MPSRYIHTGIPRSFVYPVSAFVLALASGVSWQLRTRASSFHPRVAYGLEHLPAALLAITLSVLLATLVAPLLCQDRLERQPTWRFVAAIAIVYALFWAPAWMAGGFVADDWRLLAGASIRTLVLTHPWLSLSALDTVDGNFRPLGTVLYVTGMLRAFGTHAPRAFTFGPLLSTFVGGLVAFAIVREMGHTRRAAAAAALLYLSRGMLYTVVTWMAALGDSLAILFCGLCMLCVLKAERHEGRARVLLHAAAWVAFALATLAKQSAFAAPLIVALVLFVRPGRLAPQAIARRIAAASVALVVYGATAAGVFLHEKTLLNWPSPYPLGITVNSVLHLFSVTLAYFAVIELPNRLGWLTLLPSVAGLLLTLAAVVALRRRRSLLGDRPNDTIFALLAALASMSLFIVLRTRGAAYYGCMSAFWISIALALVLTGRSAPDAAQSDSPVDVTALSARRCTVFLLLLLSGYAEVRLEQTGLIPSGGYVWGTFGTDLDRQFRAYVDRRLDSAPDARTVVFENCRNLGDYPGMVLLDGPGIERILVYDDNAGRVFINNRQGLRPTNDRAGLTDRWAYNWYWPLDGSTANHLLHEPRLLRIPCREGFLPADTQPAGL